MSTDRETSQLFDSDGAPYVRGSRTSLEAARAIIPNQGTEEWKVLNWLEVMGPSTDEQIQFELDMNPSTERPRRVKLVEKGLVRAAGIRKTRAGRKATIWEAV